MQNLRATTAPESETLGVEPSNLCLTILPDASDAPKWLRTTV